MVFLRLTVKVYPPDPIDQPQPPSSFRSFFPGGRDRDDPSRKSSNVAAGEPVNFLIAVDDPEDVTMGGLAGMIQDRWKKLRPKLGPLDIKRLVDDEHDADDLDADMTLAEVFVDNGKARVDGRDQRGTVRVIQNRADIDPHSPVRYTSVSQDWEAAWENFERIKKEKVEENLLRKLPDISEEPHRRSASRASLITEVESSWSERFPLASVEKDEIPRSASQIRLKSPFRDDSRQSRRMESQELGDSPQPVRTVTPKGGLSALGHGSMQSQGSIGQSTTSEIHESDSPALQLERESQSTASPQKTLAPTANKSGPDSPEEITESESESVSEEESDGGDKDSSRDAAGPDKDGDIAMHDEDKTKRNQSSLPSIEETPNSSMQRNSSGANTHEIRSRKRKNSPKILEPNKEPRLAEKGRASTPIALKTDEKPSTPKSGETPKVSPRRERTPSFSRASRRLSFSGPTEPPQHGLGMGITKSPPKKQPVLMDLSLDSAQSGDDIPTSTPFIPSSAPPERRGSIPRNISTPKNLQTPSEKVKNLHSALRKDATVERSSERRSVSFADYGEDEDLLITGSAPAPPKSKARSTAKSPKVTPTARTGSEKRLSSGGTVNYPAGVSEERIKQIEREAEEKLQRQNLERTEFEDKIKAARERKADPGYIHKVQLTFEAWNKLLKAEKSGRQADINNVSKYRAEFNRRKKELEKLEASMGKGTPQVQQGKKSQPQPQPARGNEKPKSNETPVAPTSNGVEILPVTQVTPWKPINSDKKTPNSADITKSTALATNGTTNRAAAQRKSTPKTPAVTKQTTPARSRTPIASKSITGQSQSSNGSDDLELPAMGSVQRPRRASSVAASTVPKKLVQVSSSSSSSSSSSESEYETSSSEDGDTSSGSEDESTKPKPSTQLTPSKKANGPPRQTNTPKQSTPSSQPRSASQPWNFPAPRTQNDRIGLKVLLEQQKSQPPPPRPANVPPRRNVFSPPDTDSDETESSSSSSDDSDDSDSDNDNEKKSEKAATEDGNSENEGDIMSSGQVRKLRNPRRI